MLLKDKIPFHYTFGNIKYAIAIVLSYSVLVWILYHNFHFVRIAIPLSVPAILGTVISLLLGFRSNQAYDRWWEARHIWGAIVNESRTLGRQSICFMSSNMGENNSPEIARRMVRRQIAWANALGLHLRGKDPMENIEAWLTIEDINALAGYTNKPAALLVLHAADINQALAEGWINRYQQVELDRTVTRLCDAQGKCERIKNTIFPATYSQYIHFSLLLFIGLLPFGLIDYFGIAEILVVTAISSCFLLIEKMAIQLQDPFEDKPTDTPVTTISRNIAHDLKQMLGDKSTPIKMPTPVINEADPYYIM